MISPTHNRVHFIKEVSLPPLNFHSMATLRTMLNLVGGGGWRVKEGSVVYILSKSFCLVNVMLVSLYLYSCLLVCEAVSLFFCTTLLVFICTIFFIFYCVFCLACSLKS